MHTKLLFIDRPNFNELINQKLTFDEITNLVNSILTARTLPNSNNISIISIGSIRSMNIKLNSLLNFNQVVLSDIISPLNVSEKEYVEHLVDSYLKDTSLCCKEKYYEALPSVRSNDCPDIASTLIVVDAGFLLNMTTDKNNLIKFILNIVSRQYYLGFVNYSFLKEYLKIKFNPLAFDVFKAKVA